MPVVFRDGPYRFLFYGSDRAEPAHVHVRRDKRQAKFWLEPFVRLERNVGFKPHELNEIEKVILDRRDDLLEAWNAFFGR